MGMSSMLDVRQDLIGTRAAVAVVQAGGRRNRLVTSPFGKDRSENRQYDSDQQTRAQGYEDSQIAPMDREVARKLAEPRQPFPSEQHQHSQSQNQTPWNIIRHSICPGCGREGTAAGPPDLRSVAYLDVNSDVAVSNPVYSTELNLRPKGSVPFHARRPWRHDLLCVSGVNTLRSKAEDTPFKRVRAAVVEQVPNRYLSPFQKTCKLGDFTVP